ncbi:MAG: hypothetical protein IKG84_05135 [Bacteroidales bacterium]|nr:hypothetical protein [Bacteroidales bacterium]
MKKALFLASLLAAALSFVGCNKEAEFFGRNGRKMQIVLSDVDTRTVNDGLATKWVDGDALNVFYAPAGTTDYSANTKFEVDDAAANHATGTAELTAAAYDWYLMYPYDSHVKTPASTNAGYLTIGSAASKQQTQKGLSNMAHLAGTNLPVYGVAKNVAKDVTPEVTMKQVASVVAVNVTNATGQPLAVDAVTFTAPEDVVGTFYIDFTGEALAFVGSGANYVSKTATLDVTEADAIAAGASAKFYIAVKPFAAKAGDKLAVKINSGEQVFEKEITLPSAVEFKSGVIKTLNISYTGGTVVEASTLEEIAAMDKDTDVVTGEVLVVAKNAKGVMLCQDGFYLQAYANAVMETAIGDIVTVSGKVGEYSGLKQIVNPEVTIVSSGNEVKLPDPKVLEGLDEYESSKIELIQYAGTLKVSGNYYNVEVAGSNRKGSIQYPLDADALKALANKPITATGFFTGISSSTYVNIMSTSVVEKEGNVFDVTPTQINVAASATSAEINVTGNVAWTAEASDGATVSPTSGTGASTITVSFPANDDTENTKDYTVFVRTEAEGVNDEFEVNITQAKAVSGTVIFNETFDGIEGTGGRDGQFGGQVASSDFKDTDEEWADVNKMYGANKCAKYGTSSADGTMTTRSISLTGNAVLTFEAAGWSSGTNKLTVTASGATLSGDTSITLSNGAWSAYSVDITGATGSFTLTFSGRRGFIDDIKVTTDSEVPPVTNALVSISISGQQTEFNVGDTFTLGSNAKVTASYSDGSTKDVTSKATHTNPDMSTAGTKEVTVSYTEGEVTKDTKYNITVKDGSPASHAGTLDDPYTVADAMAATTALGEGNTSTDYYYTKGIISEIVDVSPDYGNATYFISDDGNTGTQFKVFRGKYIGNMNFTSADQIKVGDEVVINGKLTYYKPSSGDSEIEIAQNNYIYSLKRDGAYQYALSAKAAKTSVSSAAATVKVSVYGNVDWTSAVTNPATLDVSSGSGIGSFNVSIPENTGDARSFVVTVASSKAETVTIRIDQAKKEETPSNVILIDGSQLTSTATTEVTEQTFNGVTVVFSPGAKVQGSTGENRFSDSAILIGKSGAYINNKTAVPGKIVKFEIYANKGASAKVSVGVNFSASPISEYNADAANTFTATLSDLDTVYDCTDKLPADAKYFWYQVTNAYNSQVQFRITYE